MTNLFGTPPVFYLPLIKGQDLLCRFVYKPLVVDGNLDPILDGNGDRQYAEADYPVGATVTLTIDHTTPVVAAATITTSRAVVLVDHLDVDDVKANKLWRVVITYSDAIDKVLCNGLTVRSDGK